jgi:hypothetical protein
MRMAKKRLTIEELKERREDLDQAILRTRKILETHALEREKIYSAENRRRLSPQGLAEDEAKLRRKTEMSLATAHAAIAKHTREAGEHRDTWTYEHALRNARFAREYEGLPYTAEAKTAAILHEMLEDVRRGNAERRAARYNPEDLAIETGFAAERGDVALLSVFQQEARNRKLEGLEKVNFDSAFKQLKLPEIDEAQTVFSELEGLAQEADSLFRLWREPNSEVARGLEQLGRYNRRKKAEQMVANELAKDEQTAKAAEGVKLIPTPASAFVPVPPEQSSAA